MAARVGVVRIRRAVAAAAVARRMAAAHVVAHLVRKREVRNGVLPRVDAETRIRRRRHRTREYVRESYHAAGAIDRIVDAHQLDEIGAPFGATVGADVEGSVGRVAEPREIGPEVVTLEERIRDDANTNRARAQRDARVDVRLVRDLHREQHLVERGHESAHLDDRVDVDEREYVDGIAVVAGSREAAVAAHARVHSLQRTFAVGRCATAAFTEIDVREKLPNHASIIKRAHTFGVTLTVTDNCRHALALHKYITHRAWIFWMSKVDVDAAIAAGSRAPDALTVAKKACEVIRHCVTFNKCTQRRCIDRSIGEIGANAREFRNAVANYLLVFRIKMRIRRQCLCERGCGHQRRGSE